MYVCNVADIDADESYDLEPEEIEPLVMPVMNFGTESEDEEVTNNSDPESPLIPPTLTFGRR